MLLYRFRIKYSFAACLHAIDGILTLQVVTDKYHVWAKRLTWDYGPVEPRRLDHLNNSARLPYYTHVSRSHCSNILLQCEYLFVVLILFLYVAFWICDREKPLAMYIFTSKKKNMQLLIDQTTAGGITVNDCNTHYAGIVFNWL